MLFKEPIRRDNHITYTFKIKRISTKRRIFLGILNNDQREALSSINSEHSICYSGFGCLYGINENEVLAKGGGFKKGDTITMSIDLNQGKIVWIINSINKIEY